MIGPLVLRPSAKINLTLRVGARRADGYHDVRTVLQSIALSDRLTLAAHRGPFRLQGARDAVPMDRTNLVWRAAVLLWRALGRPGEPAGVRITLEKGIPVGAGLGGGSADAAAALSGLNAIWRGRLPRRALLELAAELGSDVPFFLVGGAALALGRGEQVFPLADARRGWLVVIKPSFDVSTADAYRWFDEDAGVEPGAPTPRAGARAPRGSAQGLPSMDLGWPTDPTVLANDLQMPVARRHPGILDALQALQRAGARAAMMSGSGSAVYGAFAASTAAARATRHLGRPGWRAFVTRTLSRREAERRIALC